MNTCFPEFPVVSVIIPIYNVEPYLVRCLQSVCAQSYPCLEIILVDDGSSDGSGAICDTYAQMDKRIKVHHQTNAGLSLARNQGLLMATGVYIFFLDSDDFLHVDCIKTLWTLCQTHQCNLAHCSAQRGADSAFSPQCHKQEVSVYTQDTLFDQRRVKITAWGKLYHRSLLEGLWFAPGRIHEDEGFTYIPLYQAKRFVHTTWNGYYYYQRANSITGKRREISMDFMVFLPERLAFFQRHGDAKQINITHKEYAIKLMLAYIKASKRQSGEIWALFKEQYAAIAPATYLSKREMAILTCFRMMPSLVAFGVQLLSRWKIWGMQYG